MSPYDNLPNAYQTFDPRCKTVAAAPSSDSCVPSLTKVVAAANVTVAFEFLGPAETNFINTASETIALLEKIDSPNVRLHLDVKAMAADSIPIPEIVRKSLPWAAHFHANDPNLRGPGMGDIDFEPIAATLIEGGYHGWVSVEVFDTGIAPETLAAESMKNLRSAFR
jgi:sugar phosphate isomerase/epimerase